MKHIHFIGVGGIGVSALAQVAQARGSRVSGSDNHIDPETNPAVRRLQAGGASLYQGHHAENVSEDVDLVVASAAIAEDNPEIREARRRGIRTVSRADFLGELMAAHKGPKIAVAGTHGKTTTTGMIGVMLQHAGLDPTVFVGGEVAQLGGNVRIGSETGPFVAEACEAYDSFLSLKPDIAVITNIEADHLDHYGTFDKVLESFLKFARNVPWSKGDMIACADDPGIQKIADELTDHIPYLGYGIDFPSAGSRAIHILLERATQFDWVMEQTRVEIKLQVPGRHNILNALAAATVGYTLRIPKETIAAGLEAFRGAGRRQEILGDVRTEDANSILVMDDYAHHPTEIRATLEALRGTYPDRRLVAVFQPHLYSRTRDFLTEFADALSQADALVVTDIYAARESPIEGVRAADIVTQATERNPSAPAMFLPDKRDIPAMLTALAQPNDLVVFLGAGDIRDQGEAFVQLLQSKL